MTFCTKGSSRRGTWTSAALIARLRWLSVALMIGVEFSVFSSLQYCRMSSKFQNLAPFENTFFTNSDGAAAECSLDAWPLILGGGGGDDPHRVSLSFWIKEVKRVERNQLAWIHQHMSLFVLDVHLYDSLTTECGGGVKVEQKSV